MSYVLLVLGAYLIGSFPTGYVMGRARGIDVRKEGSGNIGATNTLRVLGKKWGYACLALDVGKGLLAVLLAKLVVAPAAGIDPVTASIIAAIAVVLGHNFPVWLGFKGGKGVATSAGAIGGLFHPAVFIFGMLSWILAFKITRVVSIASMVGAVVLSAAVFGLWMLDRATTGQLIIGLALTVMLIWRHRSNIGRLMAGTEPRFEKRPKS
jgi:glycerol-3-phosphate acyltransferase PlsY